MIQCKTILDELPFLVWVTGVNTFDVTYFNKTWHDYTGITPEDVAHGWTPIVHPDDIERVTGVLQAAQDTLKPYEVEVRLLNGVTGEYRWFLSQCSPIFEKETLLGWVGSSLDITELKARTYILESSYNEILSKRVERIKELEIELEIHKSKA